MPARTSASGSWERLSTRARVVVWLVGVHHMTVAPPVGKPITWRFGNT